MPTTSPTPKKKPLRKLPTRVLAYRVGLEIALLLGLRLGGYNRAMRRIVVAGLVLVAFLAVAGAAAPPQGAGDFVPPHCLTASDVSYPISTSTSGLVTFQVSLDSDGQATDIQTLRDIPPLTDAALVSLHNWTFAPAMLNGNGVPSTIDVDILFNPGNAAFGHPPPVPPASPARASNEPQPYTASVVVAASYAAYPITTMLAGTVVMDIELSSSGRLTKATPVFTTPSLVRTATSAVKRWRFAPAKFQGAAVRSDTTVAFVFRSPTITTPYGSQVK
jgi:Gram-negative bacterial TonB protein C-terminal